MAVQTPEEASSWCPRSGQCYFSYQVPWLSYIELKRACVWFLTVSRSLSRSRSISVACDVGCVQPPVHVVVQQAPAPKAVPVQQVQPAQPGMNIELPMPVPQVQQAQPGYMVEQQAPVMSQPAAPVVAAPPLAGAARGPVYGAAGGGYGTVPGPAVVSYPSMPPAYQYVAHTQPNQVAVTVQRQQSQSPPPPPAPARYYV